MNSNRIILGGAIIGFLSALIGIVIYFSASRGVPGAQGTEAAASGLPVVLWWLGSFFLGTVMIFGLLSNRYRGLAERQATEQATRRSYAAQEKAGDEQLPAPRGMPE